MKTKPIMSFTVMTSKENVELLHSMTSRRLDPVELEKAFIVVRITNHKPTPLDLKTSTKSQGKILSTDALSALVILPSELWTNFIRSM